MEYHVTIEETVSNEFIIEADNIDSLRDKENMMYRNSELILEPVERFAIKKKINNYLLYFFDLSAAFPTINAMIRHNTTFPALSSSSFFSVLDEP